jgi:hypothetical protein
MRRRPNSRSDHRLLIAARDFSRYSISQRSMHPAKRPTKETLSASTTSRAEYVVKETCPTKIAELLARQPSGRDILELLMGGLMSFWDGGIGFWDWVDELKGLSANPEPAGTNHKLHSSQRQTNTFRE